MASVDKFDLSDQGLEARFGLPVPKDFAEFLRCLQQHVTADLDLQTVFHIVTGMDLGGPEFRYSSTPVELFPFARPGVDGIHFGWVVHRLADAADYPVGQVCPADSNGTVQAGANTRDALENLLIFGIANHGEPEELELIQTVAREIGITPNREKPGSDLSDPASCPRVVPTLPPGWKFMTTLDGIGVMAEESRFDPAHGQTYTPESEMPDLADFKDKAEESLAAGFPASALVHLRNYICDPPGWEDYGPSMVEIYEALDRPLLARACKLRETEG